MRWNHPDIESKRFILFLAAKENLTEDYSHLKNLLRVGTPSCQVSESARIGLF